MKSHPVNPKRDRSLTAAFAGRLGSGAAVLYTPLRFIPAEQVSGKWGAIHNNKITQ